MGFAMLNPSYGSYPQRTATMVIPGFTVLLGAGWFQSAMGWW